MTEARDPVTLAGIGCVIGLLIIMAVWLRLTPRAAPLRALLQPGERRLWTGAPVQGLRLTWWDLPRIVVAAVPVWVGLKLIRLGLQSDIAGPPGAIVGALAFLMMGVFWLFGHFFEHARRRKTTSYLLTNRRAMVRIGDQTFEYGIETLRDATVSAYRDGTGTITLGGADAVVAKRLIDDAGGRPIPGAQIWRVNRKKVPIQWQFELIPDAPNVHRMMLEAAAAFRAE